MMSQALFVMFIAHFLGDYILTTGEIANGKSTAYRYTLLHCMLYALIHYVASMFLGFTVASFLLATVISLSHAIVDFGKSYITINVDKLRGTKIGFLTNGKLTYVLDQLSHYFLTFLFCSLISPSLGDSGLILTVDSVVIWLFLYFAILWQPTYVTYRVMTNTGCLIGNPFELHDLSLKLCILFVAFCYVVYPLIIILPFIIYLILPTTLKDKVELKAMITSVGVSLSVAVCLNILMTF